MHCLKEVKKSTITHFRLAQSITFLMGRVETSDGVRGQPHAQSWYSLATFFRHMDIHVCTDDIGSLRSYCHADIYWHGIMRGGVRKQRWLSG